MFFVLHFDLFDSAATRRDQPARVSGRTDGRTDVESHHCEGVIQEVNFTAGQPSFEWMNRWTNVYNETAPLGKIQSEDPKRWQIVDDVCMALYGRNDIEYNQSHPKRQQQSIKTISQSLKRTDTCLYTLQIQMPCYIVWSEHQCKCIVHLCEVASVSGSCQKHLFSTRNKSLCTNVSCLFMFDELIRSSWVSTLNNSLLFDLQTS